MVRTDKGGSVLKFIVVGVIMAIAVLGGAYLVRQQTTQPSPPQQPQEVVKEPEQQPPDKPEHKEEDPAPVVISPAVDALPQGGPTEAVGSLIVAALLCGAAVSYVRSRRPELSL